MRHNPFATRFTEPGAIEYRFPTGVTAEHLVDRFERLGWRAQIVGPHGSGKSTLLATLVPLLAVRGRHVLPVRCTSTERRLPHSIVSAPWPDRTVVVVDGYEQLSWWDRVQLAWLVRRRRAGLLVTRHRPTRLPVLWQAGTQVSTLREIVGDLLEQQGLDRHLLDSRFDEIWPRCDGNVRELLFTLYDEVRGDGQQTILPDVRDTADRNETSS